MKTKTVLKVALTSATVMAHPDVDMIFKEKVKEAVVVINPDSFRTFERHVGQPAMHPELEDSCHGQHHLCSHKGEPVLLQAGHHARAKTNSPIIGILTQPMPQAWKSLYNDGATYFESSHADFLQAAGARLVPVNYNLSERELEAELANLNGLYIPGDTKTTMLDSKFIETTRLSLKWAESHNTDEGKHFPVIGMGYGFLAMLQSQLRPGSKNYFDDVPEWMVGESVQQNLHLLPKETFVYDEMLGEEIERIFDVVDFYNELDCGITLDTFIYSKELKPFVPVATYEAGEGVVSNEEIVSMIEGTVMPYFGFAYRLDKAQFGFHAMTGSGQAKVDHSKFSVEHAQHVANFLVDEARLSANMFYETNKEQERLLSNQDVKTVTLPTPMYSEYDNSEESELFDFYRTEMYIFQ